MPDQPGDPGEAVDPSVAEGLPRPWGRHRLAVAALKAVLAVLALWWFAPVVRRVDWAAVWDAVAHLGGVEVVALLGVVAVRQSLNTLTYYVARFGAPLLGLTVALLAGQAEPAYAWTARSAVGPATPPSWVIGAPAGGAHSGCVASPCSFSGPWGTGHVAASSSFKQQGRR